MPRGADDTLPRGNGEWVIRGIEGDYHLGRHADELAVPAPAGGAEDFEGLTKIRSPLGTLSAATAAVLLESGDKVSGMDGPGLAANADDRSGELGPEDHGQFERPPGRPGAGVKVRVVDSARLHLDRSEE